MYPPRKSMNSLNSEVMKSGHMSNLSRCTCGGAQDRDRPEKMTVRTAVTFPKKVNLNELISWTKEGAKAIFNITWIIAPTIPKTTMFMSTPKAEKEIDEINILRSSLTEFFKKYIYLPK